QREDRRHLVRPRAHAALARGARGAGEVARGLPGLKRPFEQSVPGLGEKIDTSDAAPREAWLEILAEQNAALGLGGNLKDQRVPDLQLMIGAEIERRLDGGP